MTYRNVTGKLANPNGVPWIGTIYFTLVNRSYVSSLSFPSNTIAVTLDNTGYFTVSLWCNEEGEKNTYYIARLPDNSTFNFTLPVGTTDIDITLLETGGVNPHDPQYQSMLSFLEAYINTQIGTVAKGVISTPFSFGDASPKLIATNFTGIVRTCGVILQTSFNNVSSLQIGTPTQPSLLFNSTIDLQTVGTFEQYPGINLTVAVNIVATIALGFGVNQGNGVIYLEI